MAAGTDEGKENAENVYRNGGHSKSYATVTLDAALDSAVPAGTEVIGQNENGDEIRGTVMSAAAAGANTLEVQYATTDRQETYVNCQVGGLPDPNLQGCKCLLYELWTDALQALSSNF